MTEPAEEPACHVVAVAKSFACDSRIESSVKTVSGLIATKPQPVHGANHVVVQAQVRFERPDPCCGVGSEGEVEAAMCAAR